MIEAAGARHGIVHRDPFAYCAHAQACVARNGRLLVVFNRAPRRAFVLHPPEEPLFHNVIIRSNDRGETWSAPEVVPGYSVSGMECASLTALANGDILLNQWQFDWYPLGLARTLPDQAGLSYPTHFMRGWLASPEHDTAAYRSMPLEVLAPWVRGGGRTFTHLSHDAGLSFGERSEIATAPYSGGYGMRGAAERADGTLLLPLSDIPNYRQVFAVRSSDGGRSWQAPTPIAAADGHDFEEPAILARPSGKLIVVLRDNATRRLHQTESHDGGDTWTPARMLDIRGYPAHLLGLGDGRILMTYGWREPDFGIRAVLSEDDGATWLTDRTIRICGGLPNKNLGYPVSVEIGEGGLFTVYYGEDDTGVTSIMSTRWRL